METFDFDQRSPEWYAARAGIPTASEFATVMAKGKGSAPSKTRQTYMMKLAGEILTGEPMENYSNHHMERGRVMEDEARNFYSFMQDAEPQPVGFIRNGDKGASPDALIGDHGMLEIKTKLPHLMIGIILADKFPPEHMAQCQGQLWVAEREWVDLVCYWPNMPLFVKRLRRDDEYIAAMADAIDLFNGELRDMVEKIRNYGIRKEAA